MSSAVNDVMIYSRRLFLRTCAATGLGATAFQSLSAQSSQGDAYADSIAADEWMKKWMNQLGSAAGALHVGRFADPMYYLLKDIEWRPEPGKNVPGVHVPVGFVTDYASIPRVFWTLLPPDGLYTYPAILHDYLYWDQKGTREDADLTLRYAMEEFRVGMPTVETIYRGVRVGGDFAWRANARLKQAGEKRLLKQFPTDPKTTWRTWKNGPVF